MADDDELLDPAEIEKLLQGSAPPPGPLGEPEDATAEPDEAPTSAPKASSAPKAPSAPSPSSGGEGPLDPSEIEALLQQSSPGASPEQLLDRASSGIAAASSLDDLSDLGGTPHSYEFEEFDGGRGGDSTSAAIRSLQDVDLDLRIELGRTELLIEEVLRLKSGSVVPLDKLAGDPVDILVNGRLVARGEVLVLNDNFCVRVAEILTPGI